MIFRVTKIIRFAHCDPAGIVFYPRYAELCNEVVEDWFRDGLGVDFRALHEEHRLGIPTVRLEVEYLHPSTYGDSLDFSLGVRAIGTSSLTLALAAGAGGQERVRFLLKIVMVSGDTLRPTPIDAVWRDKFTSFSM
jgi:4-hydroxybenzoyl-CoA thioesterase